jgi:diguanylate cyclase (GGDEF)-like protein
MVAFLALAIQSYINVTKMKKSIDLIYFGSYVQVQKLSAVRDGFLLKDKKMILESWDYYKNSYKSNGEQKVVQAMDRLVNDSLKNLKRLSTKQVQAVRHGLNRVIEYEKNQAYKQKMKINEGYQETKNSFILILTLVVILIAILSYYIFKSITRNENKLGELNRVLKEMSLTDEMTRLYNRRFFNATIDQEFKRALRHQHPIYFMMMDVDNFKLYNDTYGHQKGDEVLKGVAKAIQSTLKRSEDYAFRLGGEEFGVLVSSISLKDAIVISQQILASVERLQIEHKKNTASEYVTISIGLNHMIPKKGDSVSAFIERADELLYHSKESGRNRVTTP